MGGWTRTWKMEDAVFPFPHMTYHIPKDTDQKRIATHLFRTSYPIQKVCKNKILLL
jgi:hypothetical protein